MANSSTPTGKTLHRRIRSIEIDGRPLRVTEVARAIGHSREWVTRVLYEWSPGIEVRQKVADYLDHVEQSLEAGAEVSA